MLQSGVVILIISLALCVSVDARRVIRQAPSVATTGSFMIKLEDDATNERFDELLDIIESKSIDNRIQKTIEMASMKIITARLTDEAIEEVKDLDGVECIEEETYGDATGSASAPYLWHLDRIDQASSVLDKMEYRPAGDGEGVDIYVLDTGINYNHDEFEGRALWTGYDPTDEVEFYTRQGTDCNGHGTHVASLAVGKTFGVAKKARVYSVRVLDCSASGPYSVVIDGLFHAAMHANETGRPSIISMSLSGPYSYVTNLAVRIIINEGIPVVIAAGNTGTNACYATPAGVTSAITVGASESDDTFPYFTNAGRCVDIFAPGANIRAAAYYCNSCSTTMDGTSMATPMVSGAVALLLQNDPSLTPDEISEKLIETATNDSLNLATLSYSYRSTTPNRLLYIESEALNPVISSTSASIYAPSTSTTGSATYIPNVSSASHAPSIPTATLAPTTAPQSTEDPINFSSSESLLAQWLLIAVSSVIIIITML